MASTKKQLERADIRTQLIEASPDMLLVLNSAGVFSDVLTPNHPGLWMPADEIRGKPVSDILPERMATEAVELVRRALDTGAPQVWEYQTPSEIEEQSERYYEARFVAVGANDVAVIIRDVSERTASTEALRQAEAAAKDSEARLRAILDTTANGIILMTQSGVVQSFNHAAEQIFGYSESDVIGRNVAMLMPEPDHSQHDGYLAKYVETGEAHIVGIGREVMGRRADGTEFPLELEIGRTVLDGDLMFTGIVRDITGRLEGQRQRLIAERKYQDLFESAIVGIYQATPEGVYISCNPALARMLGYESAEHLMEVVKDIRSQVYLDPSVRDLYLQMLDEHGEIEGFEAQLKRCDGSTVWTSQNVHAVYGGDTGEIIRYEGVVRDITNRKAMEQDLEEGRKQLEEANRELREADKAKDAFLSTVSHELRTPLTSVKGFAEILQAYSDIDEDSRNEFIGIIANESNRLIRLINDLLDLSKIEAGKMDWDDEPLSLRGVIQNSVSSMRSLALEKQQKVVVQAPDSLPDVVADQDKLTQVMTNLLSNAFKFSPNGATISVEAVNDGSEVIVSVEDSGIGIAAGDLPRVFERFLQVGDTLTGKPKGTGLGLTICKEIVEHYGGRIWVESEYEVGSRFFFALPIPQLMD